MPPLKVDWSHAPSTTGSSRFSLRSGLSSVANSLRAADEMFVHVTSEVEEQSETFVVMRQKGLLRLCAGLLHAGDSGLFDAHHPTRIQAGL